MGKVLENSTWLLHSSSGRGERARVGKLSKRGGTFVGYDGVMIRIWRELHCMGIKLDGYIFGGPVDWLYKVQGSQTRVGFILLNDLLVFIV